MNEPPRVNVLGVGISAVQLAEAVQIILTWAAERAPRYVCCSNVHSIIESRRDAALRAVHNRAGLVTPDGMPLVWACRSAGFPAVGRVYGPDVLLATCQAGLDQGLRHYFYGGGPGVAERLAARLIEKFPELQVAGLYAPPFRPLTAAEDAHIVNQINTAAPHVVWVGLGMPKQERWMADHVGRVRAVLVGVGAAFDFHAGVKPQAPRWMQQRGLEWAFRLATEPRRLWRRYASTIPTYLILRALQRSGLRRFPIDP
jgi:N-acetylglucosaminyldiphosphoundecaprenol N-acetyl-beta-D-mannosaminyltransferase